MYNVEIRYMKHLNINSDKPKLSIDQFKIKDRTEKYVHIAEGFTFFLDTDGNSLVYPVRNIEKIKISPVKES